MYQAFVHGAFDIRDADGRSVLPKGRKHTALLACLVLARHFRRTRKWLQGILWGEHGEAQGAASLRQALSTIRRHYADSVCPLQCDGQHVWLDPALISMAPNSWDNATLLEGMEIGEEAFEDWLREIRGAKAQLAAPATLADSSPGTARPGITIASLETCHAAPRSVAHANALVEQVISELFAVGMFEVYDQRSSPGATANADLVLAASVADAFGRVEVYLTLRERASERVVWRGSCELAGESHAADARIGHQLIAELTHVLVRRALHGSEDHLRYANNIASLLHGLFNPRSVPVPELVARLNECFAIAPNDALLYALRSTISTLQVGEHIAPSDPYHQVVAADVHQTLDLCQSNGIALALASHAEGFLLRNASFSLELSRKAIASNPANPLCWALHAMALVRCKQYDAAQRAATHATEIGRLGPLRSYLYSVACACAVINNKNEDAILFGERSYQQNTRFLAPMKYLVVAHTAQGNHRRASELAHAIREVDGRFGLQALLDPGYFIGFDAGRTLMISAARSLRLQ